MIITVCELRRRVNVPDRKPLFQRCKPFSKAGFARIDLLASSDETDNRTPIGVAIHDADQKFWLGLIGPTVMPIRWLGSVGVPMELFVRSWFDWLLFYWPKVLGELLPDGPKVLPG